MDSLQELTKGKLSPEIIENLKKADPQEMRDMLSQLLPDEDVESIMGRIEEIREGKVDEV